uniref:Ovule protein n=1 Tax=Heterorhabditis bacteriophora TaxID=37862 RepID=A0A1I7X9U6_HETBA
MEIKRSSFLNGCFKMEYLNGSDGRMCFSTGRFGAEFLLPNSCVPVTVYHSDDDDDVSSTSEC